MGGVAHVPDSTSEVVVTEEGGLVADGLSDVAGSCWVRAAGSADVQPDRS